MYISEVNIGGYRNFLDVKIPLHEGINIVIGSNNAGKSNLLQAIALVLHVNHHIDVWCSQNGNLVFAKALNPFLLVINKVKRQKNEISVI